MFLNNFSVNIVASIKASEKLEEDGGSEKNNKNDKNDGNRIKMISKSSLKRK